FEERHQPNDEISNLGGKLEYLHDGSIVATFCDGRVATDQVSRAARCALLLQRGNSDCTIAIATGFGELHGQLPVGDVTERAAALLSPSQQSIAMDTTTARLLAGRFSIQTTETGSMLSGEAKESTDAPRLLGKLTPFVGRDGELRALLDMCQQCHTASSP